MSDTFSSAGHLLTQEDAPLVAEFLEDLARKRGRLSTKEQCRALVEAAKSPRSKLHHLFPWDDKRAAALYREQLARRIIAEIEIVFAERPEDPPARAYPIVTVDGKKGPYPMRRVLARADLTSAMVEQALSDLEAWKRRYDNLRKLSELAGVFRAVDAAARRGKRKAA